MTRQLPRAACALIAVLGLVVLGCGGDESPTDNADSDFADETIVHATVEQILRDPENFSDNPVVVRGDAYRVADLGFLLADDGDAIFVGAPASRLQDLDPGEAIAVRGDVSQLDDTKAETIRDALDQHAEATEVPSDLHPIDVGGNRPFLNLRVLYGEGPGDPSLAPASSEPPLAASDKAAKRREVAHAARRPMREEPRHRAPEGTDQNADDDQPEPHRPRSEQANEQADEQAEPGAAAGPGARRAELGQPARDVLDEA